MIRRQPPGESGSGLRYWSPAERLGIAVFALSVPLAFISSQLVIGVLAIFVLVCAIIPFFPGVSFFFPVIGRGPDASAGICLSFDDGPDPVATPAVLALLRQHRLQAVFFVTGERAERYPHLIDALLADGHSIGNHSYSHDNFIMFRSEARLSAEIELTQRVLGAHGIRPHFFRPPVGINTPRYVEPLRQSGLTAVTFSRRAGDRGNRKIHGLSGRILRRLRPGDIVLLHDTAPRRVVDLSLLLAEIERLISGIEQRGLAIIPVATLLGRPAMSVLTKTAEQADRNCS
ncbi:polysaccharide deacetylase family protein [Desulfofustis glycolicus]|uniref:Peptidoglycan/xylan/chitin deacetylase, PgdA/CDA1 family n=1 Tax=Desulfofustis glycolicus DSM 9705 TaxID=1121409 RepID=A0A1M5XUK3_9BACT|nr:polysaccharide deacetylase family protein [Desulfofustis glycolicus]MCB2217222.1 polysaccharide deacetylase family protein [Desulfobulbaceae bacterium]SHI03224.1 Peptidoglycan/xylan/chitin deacetylase, PgdA/CDA1 family [Desulfofustis glycolicus DSM 9705]